MGRPAGPLLVLLLSAATPVLAAEDPVEIARDLRRLRSLFDALDNDDSGGITSAELGAPRLLEGLDADGDGILTRAEIDAALEKAEVAAKRAAEAAKPAGPKPGEAPSPKGPAPDADGGRWTAERVKAIFASDPRFDAAARTAETLRNFDRGGGKDGARDGRISREEYPAADGDAIFRRYDRTRDGHLEEREILPWMKVQIEDLWRARKNPSRLEFHYLFDLDRDGVVTRDEYAILRGNASYLREYDGDGDGGVTVEEIRYPERFRMEGRAPRTETPKPVTRTAWDLLDADRDGKVTLEEFGGNATVFRRLDRNGDGILTPHDA